MSKVLVEIYIPAMNKSYDVYIPLIAKIKDVEALLTKAFTDMSKGYFDSSESTVLCDRSTGTILDINKSVQQLNLKNGSKLMLI